MFRFLVCAVLASSLAGPGLANAQQEELCSETAKIVFVAVTERAKGKSSETVKRAVQKRDGAFDRRFLPAVGPVVDWVFAIEETDLRAADANQTIATRYRRECLSFQP